MKVLEIHQDISINGEHAAKPWSSGMQNPALQMTVPFSWTSSGLEQGDQQEHAKQEEAVRTHVAAMTIS